MNLHLKTGLAGEKEGVCYLQKLGYKILEINFKTHLGEIDCIAVDKTTLVFVEIKTRTNSHFGMPEESVNVRKRQKIIQVAELYLKKNHSLWPPEARFDVLAVFFSPQSGQYSFNHIQNAFEIESKENT